MSTISSTLALNDSMTPVLRSIASALEGVNATLDRLEANLDGAFDPQAINAATRAVQQTERVQDELTDSVRETERAQDNVTQSVRETSSAADGLWGKIKGLIAAYAGWELVRQTVAWSDEMTNIQARLAQVNDGSRTQDQLMRDIYANAQDAHASLQGMADIVGRFGNNARDAFSSNDELLAFSNQLYKMFAISGTDQNGAAAAMLQLSQGLGAGALRGEELNSVFEQAPIIIQTIADHLGVPIGQIRQMASEGKLTADVVKNALLSAADETNAKFAAMPLTFSSAWQMAKNKFQISLMGLQETISRLINTQQFQQILDSLFSAVATLGAIAIPILKVVASVVGFIYENWSLIAPAIYTVLGAMAAYKAAMLVQMAIEGVSKGMRWMAAAAQTAYAIATGTATVATHGLTNAERGLTAAQWGLNAAMWANPVGLIIAAVAALIGLMYLAVAIVNRITGDSVSMTGIIAGAVSTLWAYIKNLIAWLWNTLVTVAEFLYNVWTNPVHSLKRLLFGLLEAFAGMFKGILQGVDAVATSMARRFSGVINGIVSGINFIITGLNKIPGAEKIPTLSEMSLDEGESLLGGTIGAIDALVSNLNPGDAEGYRNFDGAKLMFADPVEYAQSAYSKAADFADDPQGAIMRALGLGQDPAIQQILDGQAAGNRAAAQIAQNTAPREDESYQYIKQIMAGRAVDRLSGADIRIQMNNNNKINSALDLDAIVNALAQKLTGAMDSAAEGVHP